MSPSSALRTIQLVDDDQVSWMDGVQVSWMRLWASDDATALARVRDVQVRGATSDASEECDVPLHCIGNATRGA